LKKLSIRQFVAGLALIPMLIMIVSLQTYFLQDRSSYLDRDFVERGKLIARQLASSSEYGVFSNNQTFLQDLARGVMQQRDVRGVMVLNAASGKLIEKGDFSGLSANATTDANQTMPDHPDPANKLPVSKTNPVYSSGENLWIYQPILPVQVALGELEVNPVAEPTGAVILEMSWTHIRKLKSRMFWAMVFVTTLFFSIAVFLAYFVSRRIASPIRKLSDAVQMIGSGHLETRVFVSDRVTELNNMAQGINAMAAQLQKESMSLHRQIEEATRIAATAFESQESLIITDAQGLILRVNKAFTESTGYTSEEIVGKKPRRLLDSGRHPPEFYRAMWETIHSTGYWHGEIWDKRKNGEIYPKLLSITAVKGGDGAITHYVGSHIDITERKAAEEEIQYLAFYDPLTRLPNRRLLQDRIRQALVSSARSGLEGALLFIDLDNFKNLNDTLGHDIGDMLLQQVGQRLGKCIREGDTVARLGGDEFVVMLLSLGKQPIDAAAQVEVVGEKILAALSQLYQLGPHAYRCSASIGATLFNDNQQAAEELMKQADIAMYQAKKAGRNTLRFFDRRMQENISSRVLLEGELQKALAKHQFHLHYQIQVDSAFRPRGAEALIRWRHPERGLVLPAQFIPLAEETGLILTIGQWVLETACAQLRVWQQDALTRDLTLSVNVSAKQFRQADFVSHVKTAVKHHAINPALIKLELTEGMLLENIEDTIAKMNSLNAIGVKLSLDDFGTGYSSLQYLKRLPLDQLKIDQSFVRDITFDRSDVAIVRTIVAMARSLGIAVIAEGVETEQQRQLLLQNGCSHYQGLLFGDAVPIGRFMTLLK
jgi:diguanylate cyclase (GGDEF)-like protein/PAS domain S-box-containing protein